MTDRTQAKPAPAGDLVERMCRAFVVALADPDHADPDRWYGWADAMTAALAAIREAGYVVARPLKPTHRHIKRGTIYTEIMRGGMQVSTDPGCYDGDLVVIYQGEDSRVWVRPVDEFDDPERFQVLAAAGGAQ